MTVSHSDCKISICGQNDVWLFDYIQPLLEKNASEQRDVIAIGKKAKTEFKEKFEDHLLKLVVI